MDGVEEVLYDYIRNRNIILWGTGNTANQFYLKYKDLLPIYACTSNETDIKEIPGLKAIPWTEIDVESDFIIICSIYYKEIRDQLLLFKEGGKFIDWKLFNALYEKCYCKKKLIVAVGQCEIGEICQVLDGLKSFRENYSIIYYNEREVCSHGDRFNVVEAKDCLKSLTISDYFMKPSAISPRVMNGFNYLQKALSKEGITITVSLFHFDSYWPQDIAKERSVNKYYMTEKDKKLAAYIERDQMIERLVDDGLTVSQIMEKITKEDLFDPEKVLENHARTIKRVRIADKLSDIKILDFIETFYSKLKLFCDRGHFNEYLLREYVKRLLLYFQSNESVGELGSLCTNNMFVELNELPIYPSTVAILGLEWVKKGTLYRQKRYDGVKSLTFEEYMESLIRYCYLMKEARSVCYFYIH